MATATDDFNRADSTDVGASWDVFTGGTGGQIVNNRYRKLNDGGIETYNGISCGADQFAKCVIASINTAPAAEVNGGVTVRNATAATTQYGYTTTHGHATRKSMLFKRVAGAFTVLTSETATTWAATDELVGTAVSAVQCMFRNGALLLTASDTAITGGSEPRVGITASSGAASADDDVELDDWRGGDLSTLTLTVGESADDAQQIGSTMTLDGTTIGGNLDATTDWAGMRFQNVTVPVSAMINTAFLSVVPSGTGTDEPLVTIYFEAADNPGTFTTTNDDISNRTRTTGVAWSNSNLGADGATYFDSPNLVADLQAVVDRAGWASGNAVVVIVQGGATSTRDLEIEAYDLGPGTNPPKLIISYIPPEAGGAAQPNYLTLLAVGA